MTRLLIWLLLAVLAAALGGGLLQGRDAAQAAAYGAGIAVINLALLAARAWQARRLAIPDPVPLPPDDADDPDSPPRVGVRVVPLGLLAISTVERMLAVVFLLALGFTVLALAPVPLLSGFVVGQSVFLLGGAAAKLESPTGGPRN